MSGNPHNFGGIQKAPEGFMQPRTVTMDLDDMFQVADATLRTIGFKLSRSAWEIIFGTDGKDGLGEKLRAKWQYVFSDNRVVPIMKLPDHVKEVPCFAIGPLPPIAMEKNPKTVMMARDVINDKKARYLWCPTGSEAIELIEKGGYIFDQLRLSTDGTWVATARRKTDGSRETACGPEIKDRIHALYVLLELVIDNEKK